MQADVNWAVLLIENLGWPAVILIVVAIAAKKIAPTFYKEWKAKEENQQKYYDQRQKQYDEQMQIIIKVAEQGNAMITNCVAVIERNNAIIQNSTSLTEKVIGSMDNNIKALESIQNSFERHDARQEKMTIDITKLAVKNGGN